MADKTVFDDTAAGKAHDVAVAGAKAVKNKFVDALHSLKGAAQSPSSPSLAEEIARTPAVQNLSKQAQAVQKPAFFSSEAPDTSTPEEKAEKTRRIAEILHGQQKAPADSGQ